jgi:acyl-CoA reductase-like NAD-dependent aldehyde dehydrogenase
MFMMGTNEIPAAVLRSDFTHLIGGQAIRGSNAFEVINPATGAAFALCPSASRAELDTAVAAARSAAPAWSARSYEERRALVGELAASLATHKDALAELLTCEQGKPIGQARDEVVRAGAQAEGMAQILINDEVLAEDSQRHIVLRYAPLGVVGIITPWNAPISLATGPLAAALYTGNTVVLKPSPYAPLVTLKYGELLGRIFPAGVVNVLGGGDELGAWMCEHPHIDKISFTGSVATGKRVMAAAAGTLKRLTLELGGNDAAIVLEDADPQAIAAKLFFAATVNSGQVCMAVKRIYAHESIYEPLCAALAEEARRAVVGNGLDPATQLGPLQNQRQYQRVLALIDDTRRRGARILAGGHALPGPGYFIAPTIVCDIEEDAPLVREEQFGPLVPILKYRDIEDAIRRANDTRYGLSGSVWGSDLKRASSIAAQLEVGTAWVNQHRSLAPRVPFGGAKESGIGRHYGDLGLKGNMEAHFLSIRK